MKKIVLEDNEGVEIVSSDGSWRLYVSLVEQPSHERFSHAFTILADKPIAIEPRSDNSINLSMEPLRRKAK